MSPCIFNRPLIGCLEVKVHILFFNTFPFDADPLVEHDLVLDLRDCRTLHRRGMRDEGVQIELVVIYLLVDAQSPIFIDDVFKISRHFLPTFLQI